MYYIYAHINRYNKKRYIGYTENPDNRWANKGIKYKTCPRFWSAICHYGWDNFEHIILYQTENKEEALQKEQDFILQYNSTNPQYGYNLAAGGTGGDVQAGWSAERKKQYSETCKQELQRRLQETNWREHLSQSQLKRYEKIRNGEMVPPKMPQGGQVHNSRKVKCVETGKVYECCADAVEELGYSRSKSSYVSRVASGVRHTFHNLHWEFVDE